MSEQATMIRDRGRVASTDAYAILDLDGQIAYTFDSLAEVALAQTGEHQRVVVAMRAGEMVEFLGTKHTASPPNKFTRLQALDMAVALGLPVADPLLHFSVEPRYLPYASSMPVEFVPVLEVWEQVCRWEPTGKVTP